MAEFTKEQTDQLRTMGFTTFPGIARLRLSPTVDYYVWCSKNEAVQSFKSKPDGFYADPDEANDFVEKSVYFDDPITAAAWLLIEASNLTNKP